MSAALLLGLYLGAMPADAPLLAQEASEVGSAQEVAPRSGEFVNDEESWRVRSSEYREWLADPRSFLLIARSGERAVGYSVVRVMESGVGAARRVARSRAR